MSPPAPNAEQNRNRNRKWDRWILFLAEGFGSGRLHPAPGTWGSVVGVGWSLALLAPGHPVVFLLGTALGIAAAIWSSGWAELLLGRHDPGSVVIDEIAAVPCCFLAAILGQWSRTGAFPALADFLRFHPVWLVPAAFGLFRLFDIWKPWPIRTSQRLPGGWGIVADDVLAAFWVNGVLLALRLPNPA